MSEVRIFFTGPATRLVAILGGGDWHDASVDHVNVPATLDLDEAMARWRQWYRDIYLPAVREWDAAGPLRAERPKYLDLPEWLILTEEGASRASVEEFES